MGIGPVPFLYLLLVALSGLLSPASLEKTRAQPGAKPADRPAKPERKQLQFWVGEWEVTDKDKKIGTSTIQWIADGQAILENYSQPGFSGKSLTFIDGVLGKWRQTWVDSQGRVSDFVGEYKEGAMRFEGNTHTADGKKLARRMVLQPLESAGVRHYSERSDDGGKTWVKLYDYTYRNKK